MVQLNQRFKKVLDKSDFDLAGGSGTQSVDSGKWNEIGAYEVPPQLVFHFGYGSGARSRNQGYLYVLLQDDASTPNEIEGKVRLVQKDHQKLDVDVVYENQESVLHGSKTDINQKIPLPEQTQQKWVGQESYLSIEFKPNSDDTLSYSNSDCQVPVTVGKVAN